jgi:molybdopterin/thiamine biosynthesis adenylyltransferase
MNLELAYSRPQASALALSELADDRHRFIEKSVLLTGEPHILSTRNGTCCFLDSLRLLVRVCANVTVSIPPACPELREVASTLAKRITFGKDVVQTDGDVDFTRYDAVLSVGSSVHPQLPWTAMNSNGWVARISSGDRTLDSECRVNNPIGALAAASIGVGEVFKRLIRLKAERGEFLNGFNYSLTDYRNVDGLHGGPPLPLALNHDLLLVGAGAIGNGIAHLIAQLPFETSLTIVDSQNYGSENLGTCILIGPEDLEKSKAHVLAAQLGQAGKIARGYHQSFEQFANEITQIPGIVLTALDNIDGRHEVQRTLWPNVIVDGAIGDFTCQVSRHPWPEDIACLMCLFRKPEGERSEKIQSEATGLPLEALNDVTSPLTQSHVENAAHDKKEFLRARIGRPLCSVIQEAVAVAISSDTQSQGFQPSVPFVATFSACMVMTETVAHICGWPSVLAPRFQFDFLMGPHYGQELPQGRRGDCVCGRKKNIDAVRALRNLKMQLST